MFRYSLIAGLLLLTAWGVPVRAQCDDAWQPGFAPPGLNGSVSASCVYDSGSGPNLYVAGSFTSVEGRDAPGVARWDGTSWMPLPWQFTFPLSTEAMVVHDFGQGPRLCVGSRYGPTPVVTWNGTSWSVLGLRPLSSAFPSDLCVFDDGAGERLYMATYWGLYRWNGSSSWDLIPGLSNVTALGVFDDGSGDALYAADVGLGPYIRKWVGSTWATVGVKGSVGRVSGFTVWDDGSGESLFAYGNFQQMDNVLVNGIARYDGQSWSSLAGGVTSGSTSGSGYILAATVMDFGLGERLCVGGDFYSVGGVNATCTAAWNGTSWESLGSGVNSGVTSLSAFDQGLSSKLFAMGSFRWTPGRDWVNRVASFDGSTWLAVCGDQCMGMSETVTSFATFDDGTGASLYAGGQFRGAGVIRAGGIARQTSTGWESVALGIMDTPFSSIQSLVVHDDGSGTALYAAGSFTEIGGTMVQNIASYDGAAWSDVGLGTDFLIHDMASFDDGTGADLYAGGSFLHAGGNVAEALARWDGTSWQAVGGGLASFGFPYDPIVTDVLAVHDPTDTALYVAGDFAYAGGIAVGGLARWDGSQWSSVGVPIGANVSSVHAYRPSGQCTLVVAGWFPGQGPAIYARVGTQWTQLGPNFSISSLGSFQHNGREVLVVGGNFSEIGGVPMEGVAWWDGQAWNPMGGGLTGDDLNSTTNTRSVGTFFEYDDGSGPALMVGGAFTFAGGIPSHGIARWWPQPPTLTMTQPGGAGTGIYLHNDRIVLGHEYYNVFSNELCPSGPGGGPLLGLCATTPAAVDLIVQQLLMPVGASPFHFIAQGPQETFGAYFIPGPFMTEAVTFDVTPGLSGCVSPVVRFTVP